MQIILKAFYLDEIWDNKRDIKMCESIEVVVERAAVRTKQEIVMTMGKERAEGKVKGKRQGVDWLFFGK
jgi:hypothetical protein